MKRIKTCVVGVGFIGAAHIEALRRLGYVNVTALCKRNGAEKLAEELCVPTGYSDYREMIDREKPDVVHICTPNSMHYEVAQHALEHGVNVMCEKPLAFSVAEAERLTELAKEKGLVNGVNFHCRYYPMIRQMREMVKKDALGRVISINGGYFQDWLLYDTDYSWRLESAQSGRTRAVADIGSHWVDAVEFITGQRISRVFADFATFHPVRKKPKKDISTFSNKLAAVTEYEEFPVDTEDYAQVLMEFDNGAKGNMIVTQMYAGRKNQMIISLAGMNNSLYFDSEALNDLWLGSRQGYNQGIVKDPSLLEPEANKAVSYPGGHIEGFPDAFTNNFRAFYESVRSGTPGDYASFEDGLREMRICDAIADSAKLGQWVRVD